MVEVKMKLSPKKTGALYVKNLALEKAIEGALKIKDLWLPTDNDAIPEFIEEAKALGKMYQNFKDALNR